MEITTLCAVVAALRVLPDRSQFFQYESVTVSCEQQGNCSDWKVKRDLFLYPNSDCSTSWDATNGSVCSIPDLYPSDTGAYWCESAAGVRSAAVNITVTRGAVILDGPVLPVSEGEAVTLSCRHRAPSSSAPTAHFYKDGVLLGNSSTANMTLGRVSRSDQGLYSCHMSGAGSPGSWLTVTGAATLSITPDRSQFFEYDPISLKCAPADNSTGWVVKRNTSHSRNDQCKLGWGIPAESSCTIEDAYKSDTGVYWCESERSERSNTVSITVTGGAVILESPAHPVTEGDDMVLQCVHENKERRVSTRDFNATFYKDGVFSGTEREGKMVVSTVTKQSEGVYECEHPQQGKSPPYRLEVKAKARPESVPTTPPTLPPVITLPKLLCTILLFILYTAILVICICTYRRWAKARAEKKRRVLDLE